MLSDEELARKLRDEEQAAGSSVAAPEPLPPQQPGENELDAILDGTAEPTAAEAQQPAGPKPDEVASPTASREELPFSPMAKRRGASSTRRVNRRRGSFSATDVKERVEAGMAHKKERWKLTARVLQICILERDPRLAIVAWASRASVQRPEATSMKPSAVVVASLAEAAPVSRRSAKTLQGLGPGIQMSPLSRDRQVGLAREILSWSRLELTWCVMHWAMTAMKLRMTRQTKRRLEKLERKHVQTTAPAGLEGSPGGGVVLQADLGSMDARTRSLYMLLQAQHEGDLIRHKQELALGHVLKLFRRAIADSMGAVAKELVHQWRDLARSSTRWLDQEMLGLERSQLFAYKVNPGFLKCGQIFRAHRIASVTGAMQQWCAVTQSKHALQIQEQALRAFSDLKRKEKLNSIAAQAEKHLVEKDAAMC